MRSVVQRAPANAKSQERVRRAATNSLGYKTLVGAQMRYADQDRTGWPVAMLGFCTGVLQRLPRASR